MRHYETAFLIAPNLPEEDTEQIIQQMADVVSGKKGKMLNRDDWGKRKLAYSIGNFEEAFYVFFQYEGTPDIPAELERRFKQAEPILRYLTVIVEKRKKVRRRKRGSPRKEEKPREKGEEKEVVEESQEESPEDSPATEKNKEEK